MTPFNIESFASSLTVILPGTPSGVHQNTYGKEKLERFINVPVEQWQPFDHRCTQFVSELSKRLLQAADARKWPELTALGYWFRPAHVNAIMQDYHARHLTPRSKKVWHIAPGNVDTLFLYSSLLSLLLGNSNLVRLSSTPSEQTDILVGLLQDVLTEPSYQAIADRLIVIRYEREDWITAKLSEYSDLRLIWGGDQSINHIQSIPLVSHPRDICFPTRYSFAVLNADYVVDCDVTELASLFYRDAFPYSQQACASPLSVYWIGSRSNVSSAKEKFWSALTLELNTRYHVTRPEDAIEREVSIQRAALESGSCTEVRRHTHFVRLETTSVSQSMESVNTGHGLFFEVHLEDLRQLSEAVHEKHQTVTWFGLNNTQTEWLNHYQQKSDLIRRCVPVGQALWFDPVWDGVDLMEVFVV